MTQSIHSAWSHLPPVELRSADRKWRQDHGKAPGLEKNGRTHAETVALRRRAGYGNDHNPEVKLGRYFDGSTK